MSSTTKKTKAQKKRERERQQRAQMAAELNLIQQVSKTAITSGMTASIMASVATGTGNKMGTDARPAQSGGSSGSVATPPQPAANNNNNNEAPHPTTTTTTAASTTATNTWPPAPKIPASQALSYGWKISYPNNPTESLRPISGALLLGLRAQSASASMPLASGMSLEHYKDLRRQRYVRAAHQSGLTWNCK